MLRRFTAFRAIGLMAVIGVAGLVAAVVAIQVVRVREAKSALDPLLPLGAQISSAPVATSRTCAYFVMFDGKSSLSDSNVEALLSLNRLPEGNSVFLYLTTPAVTDDSLPVIEQLVRVRRLHVEQSGISGAGIERLRQSLPEADVW